jgi:hypothetical protein
VRVRSHAGLARLSISNQLLVALARPDATFVAGFNIWIRLGYAIRKGERAVAIIAPLPFKEREQAPLGPPSDPLTSDLHAHLLGPTQAFAESLGFTVSFETIRGPTGGWCDQVATRQARRSRSARRIPGPARR